MNALRNALAYAGVPKSQLDDIRRIFEIHGDMTAAKEVFGNDALKLLFAEFAFAYLRAGPSEMDSKAVDSVFSWVDKGVAVGLLAEHTRPSRVFELGAALGIPSLTLAKKGFEIGDISDINLDYLNLGRALAEDLGLKVSYKSRNIMGWNNPYFADRTTLVAQMPNHHYADFSAEDRLVDIAISGSANLVLVPSMPDAGGVVAAQRCRNHADKLDRNGYQVYLTNLQPSFTDIPMHTVMALRKFA